MNTRSQFAIVILKETVIRYASQNSDVHGAMVDLTKAFDKIDMNILTAKWKNVCMYIILYVISMAVLIDFRLCNVYAWHVYIYLYII